MLRRAWFPWLLLAPAGCAPGDARATDHADVAAAARAAGDTAQAAQYWDLQTGSRIAYRHVPAKGEASLPPLVFLHGGPGAYIVTRFDDSPDWWRQLASLGFDVYAYDQVGSGLSARLKDPAQYTVARHVADLEAIRARIGAERMVLVGDSWGASLAAHYIAVHSGRVQRAIFTSPGAIDHRDWDPALTTPRFSPAMLEWVRTNRGREEYRHYLQLDSLLQQRDVPTAYARFGDAEMDPMMDAWITGAILGRTVHDPAKVRDERMHGMGWWVQHMTAWDALATAPAVRGSLAKFERPVLILHGTSDYLPAGMSEQYAAAFPHARIVHIPDCGHLIWLERPDVYGAEILGFLRQLVGEGAAPASTADRTIR